MTTPEIPKVEYIDALTADNAGLGESRLAYNGLGEAVRRYAKDKGPRIDAFWEAEPGSIEELVDARQLAFEYFVATAEKVVGSGPQNRDLWADRYTKASIELFGAPDPEEATRLVARQASEFQSLRNNENVSQDKLRIVLEQYDSVLESNPDVIEDEADSKNEAEQELAIREIDFVLKERYGAVLDLVANSEKTTFNQADLVELFSDALEKLAKLDDEAWGDWKVVSPEKGTGLSVNGKKQEIKIPKKRAAVDADEARKLLAHELLVHGLRAKNGRKSDDDRMLKGFPGYLDAEEGLGIIAGAAASGQISETIYDRYVDVALATGLVGGVAKKRHDLYELAYARSLVRAQAKGEKIDEAKLRKKTSAYVDRIYRGSPGDDIGTRQAIYTADIYYYSGLKKMSNYISEKLKDGHGISSLFDYLMQGKFDPTNPLDVKRVGPLT